MKIHVRRGESRRHVVVVFGLGLIGGAVDAALALETNHTGLGMPYDWKDRAARDRQREQIVDCLVELLEGSAAARLDAVWAAGRSGFGSDDAQMAEETALFSEFLDACEAVRDRAPALKLSIHLIGSAGGLFEGVTQVDSSAIAAPQRPYGFGKRAQEALLMERFGLAVGHIYRPSSVYGFRPGARAGLISALIRNGLENRTTRIVGAADTIRDYVFADDIGRFIAGRTVIGAAPPATPYLLASGKPTSMYEVISLVERALQRRLYLQYDSAPDNAQDMSFRSSSLPAGWMSTPLETGVYRTIQRVKDTMLVRS